MTDPTPPLPSPPPVGYVLVRREQCAIDAEHLRLLALFHYIFAGLGVLGFGFLGLHYTFMHTMFSYRGIVHFGRNDPSQMSPQFFAMFKWFYLFAAGLIVVGMVLNVISAWCMARRKARLFSMVVAGLDCLQMPFGTALGVFTLIVLVRDSVREVYEEQAVTSAPPAPAG